MNAPGASINCACECGVNRFTVQGEPLLRAVCHCHFCQDFNRAGHADFLIYRQRDVTFDQTTRTRYRSFKKPEFVKRGCCTECGMPVNERVRIPLLPQLVFVPAGNHPDRVSLPAPKLHMFYHRRIADVKGHAPKYSGYLWSEANFMACLIKQLLRRS